MYFYDPNDFLDLFFLYLFLGDGTHTVPKNLYFKLNKFKKKNYNNLDCSGLEPTVIRERLFGAEFGRISHLSQLGYIEVEFSHFICVIGIAEKNK